MFVATNAVPSVITYFEEKLIDRFTLREIRVMAKAFICERFNWSDSDYLARKSNAQCSESDLLFFRSAVKRMQQGEPFQYVLGKTWFYGVELICDQRALIPRPETEELVDWVVQEMDDCSCVVMDLGTGSGCIPIAVKVAKPNAHVIGVDVCSKALSLAIENTKKEGVDVDFVEHDLLSDRPLKNTVNIDVLISNPPYIPIGERKEMAKHVVDFEPEKALFVPEKSPLLFYEKIIAFSNNYLNPLGKLFLEIHENLSNDVLTLLRENGFTDVVCRKDMQGKPRMIKAIKSNH